MDVYLEIGSKRTFAGALDWPGLCRSAAGEELALQALCYYGPRYALAMQLEGIPFRAVCKGADLNVVERLQGNKTTDFGAPAVAPTADSRPLNESELAHFETLLMACWSALDAAVAAAAGKDLRLGPRGGGRTLEQIVDHVHGAQRAYLGRIGWKPARVAVTEPLALLEQSRREALAGLESAVRTGVPEAPRGGARWSPRYFIRRVAWHALDHAWEIEDRIIPG